jgi:hypothetical protein
MSKVRWWLTPLLVGWASWACAQTGAKDVPGLDLVPAQISATALTTEAPLNLDVHLSAGNRALSNIALSVFSNDAIQLLRVGDSQPAEAPPVKSLAPGSEHSWSLQLTRVGDLLASAKVYVRVSFDTAEDGKPSTHRVLYATADITPRGPINKSATAAADLVGPATVFSHEREGQVLLQITNSAAEPLQLKALRFYKPKFVHINNEGGEDASEDPYVDLVLAQPDTAPIPSGQSIMIPVSLSASPRVIPGKYTVVAQATLMTPGNVSYTTSASREVEVVVLGESDLLKLIGVPSFLFLPGALMVIGWGLLWSIGKTADERDKFPLQPTKTDFWVIAIALSLFSAFVYPWVTHRVLGETRDYLGAYGFNDFAYIFGFSLLCTLGVFGIYKLLEVLWRLWKQYQLRQAIPQTGDSAQHILEKLARVGSDTRLRQVYQTGGQPTAAAMVLEPWSTDSQIWVVPPAHLTLKLNRSDDAYYEALDERDRIVTDEVTDTRILLQRIRDGVASKWWTLDWSAVGTLQGPAAVKFNAWTEVPRRAWLVR